MRFEFEIELKPVRKVREKKPKESSLRNNLVLAYQIQDLLDQGKARTLEQIAKWIGFNRARISQLINLPLLAADIQREIMLSEKPSILNISEYLVRKIPLEADWSKQNKMWQELISSSLNNPSR